ncbi:hypothetical protein AB3K78_15385 [Leucobacter sp. HNU]|uniref:hypothetical protein n=1 Tax=Leucobacter sp. HNU TaxID=3236805 RepID=UPI003A80DEFD
MSTKKGMAELDLGPTGKTVAVNIARRREALNLSYVALEQRLIKAGQRIPALGLRRIEARARKVDVDELLALAFALECTPTFLLSPLDPEAPVTAIKDGELIWEEKRAWLQGKAKLTPSSLAHFWERESLSQDAVISASEYLLRAVESGQRSPKPKHYYEAERDEAVARKAFSDERRAHFTNDFEGDTFAWNAQDD